MSSYIKKLINPKTKKEQEAFCIDDYYGSHRYGYFFRKDGSDANWDDFNLLQQNESQFDIFDEYEMEQYNFKKSEVEFAKSLMGEEKEEWKKSLKNIPMGIDEWIEQGQKYKYFDYILDQLKYK